MKLISSGAVGILMSLANASRLFSYSSLCKGEEMSVKRDEMENVMENVMDNVMAEVNEGRAGKKLKKIGN